MSLRVSGFSFGGLCIMLFRFGSMGFLLKILLLL